MAKQHHTLIFVPHARARLRKWRVTSLQLRLVVSIFAVLTLTATWISWSYLHLTVDSAELERLRAENEGLRDVNRSFEVSVADLEQQLAGYEERTRQLAIVAGLDVPPPGTGGDTLEGSSEAGIGGSLVSDGWELPPLEAEAEPEGLSELAWRAGSLDEQLDDVEASLEDRLRWISSTPAITPARGIFTSGFGYRRDPIHGRRAVHHGLDISAAPGQPVRATADGVVVRAGRSGGLGLAVSLSHGYGLKTRYGHLSKLAVEAGAEIERGDVIGYVGNSGRSTGYHLHYEVHVDGKPVNPIAYILDSPSDRS